MRAQDVEVFVKLSPHQKKKLAKAIQDKTPTKIRLAWDDLVGEERLIMSPTQKMKMENKREKGLGCELDFSLDRLQRNKEIIGGFLPLLANVAKMLAPIVLPAIAQRLLGSNQEGEGLDSAEKACCCACHKGNGMITHGSNAPPPALPASMVAIGSGMITHGSSAPPQTASMVATGSGMVTHGSTFAGIPQPAVAGMTGTGMFIHGSKGARNRIVPEVQISGGRVRKQKPKPEPKKKD